VKRRFLGLTWINPFLILYLAFVPIELAKLILGPIYLLDNGVNDPYLGFAIFINNISLFLKLVLTYVFLKLFGWISLSKLTRMVKSHYLSPLKMQTIELMFFLGSLTLFYLMADYNMGFLNWLEAPRAGYQYNRVGVGSFYALSLTLLSMAFTVGLIRQSTLLIKIAKALCYLGAVYFWGSKGFLISFYLFFLIALWFTHREALIPVFIATVIPVFIGILYNLTISIGPISIEKFAGYFNYFYNSAMFFEAYYNGDIPLFKGKILITNLWSLVPRILFDEKPFVYGITHINEIFYPGLAERTHTPAFGGPVAAFADFGIMGVILMGLLDFYYIGELLLTYILFRLFKFNRDRHDSMYILVFILVFSPKLFWRVPLIYSVPLYIMGMFLINTIARLKLISVHPRT